MDINRVTHYYQQHKTQLPWLIAAIIVLFTFSTIISRIDYFRVTIPPTTSTAASAAQPLQLASLHLFGLFSDDFDDLPETQLQLTLEGTGVDPHNPKLSSAIIASGETANSYQIGDSIPGDAVIKDILFDRIVISNNGELQKLSMQTPKLENQPAGQGLPTNSGLKSA